MTERRRQPSVAAVALHRICFLENRIELDTEN